MTDIIMVKGSTSSRVQDAVNRMIDRQRRSLKAGAKEIKRLEDGIHKGADQPSATAPCEEEEPRHDALVAALPKLFVIDGGRK